MIDVLCPKCRQPLDPVSDPVPASLGGSYLLHCPKCSTSPHHPIHYRMSFVIVKMPKDDPSLMTPADMGEYRGKDANRRAKAGAAA